MKRYTCPTCDTGRIAPDRMSTDDVRRYCLPCSEDSGKLVEMICPARERAKAKRRKARAKRRKAERKAERERKRQEERERFCLDDGTDIRDLVAAVKALPTWQNEGAPAHRAVSRLTVEREAYGSLPWDTVAVAIIRKATRLALCAVGVSTTYWNVDACVLNAGCRLFNVDRDEVKAVAHNLARLHGWDELNYSQALVTCSRARGNEAPTS